MHSRSLLGISYFWDLLNHRNGFKTLILLFLLQTNSVDVAIQKWYNFISRIKSADEVPLPVIAGSANEVTLFNDKNNF